MLKSDYGYIVNVASIAAFGGYPYSADYSASKAAVLNFSEALRSELYATGRLGINITCVCPLFINTRMVWESRALKKGHTESTMEPSYVAKRIITAMSDKQFLLALPRLIYFASFFKRLFHANTHSSPHSSSQSNFSLSSPAVSCPRKHMIHISLTVFSRVLTLYNSPLIQIQKAEAKTRQLLHRSIAPT